MIDLLHVDEGQPSAYPDPPSGLSPAAAALDAAPLWQRLEGWMAWRWGERTVSWVVQGRGLWSTALRPATVQTVEVWDATATDWTATTLPAAPLGLQVPDGVYRITALVGSTDTPPPDVLEAYRRYAEYTADFAHAGRVATSSSRRVGDITVSSERPAAWQAKALHYSGAADLLRRYR